MSAVPLLSDLLPPSKSYEIIEDLKPFDDGQYKFTLKIVDSDEYAALNMFRTIQKGTNWSIRTSVTYFDDLNGLCERHYITRK